jgi:protein tyrosine/serine phosphatase
MKARSIPLFPPMNFNAVDDGLYRSGIPFEINFEFLKTLKLKTVIVLSPEYLDEKAAKFFEDNNIQIIIIEDKMNDSLRGLYPLAEEMVTEALQIISSKHNLPLLVICKTGKNLTGVVVACLRKLQQWSFASIFEEYRRYAGLSRLQQQHEQFVEIFDNDLIKITIEDAPSFLSTTDT